MINDVNLLPVYNDFKHD